MIELHPDTKEKLADVLLNVLKQVQQDHDVDTASEALESALGEFCRDHLDCDTDEHGSVVVRIAAEHAVH